jgi:hypothetical protein
MPMTIARITRERTLGTLVKNLFVIEGPNAGHEAKRAEAALLRANPHLADRDAFQAGAVIVIPADIALKRTERVAARTSGLGSLLSESAERLDVVLALAQDRLKREAAEARLYLERLGDDAFRRAVSQSPSGQRVLAEAEEVQKVRLEATETRAKALATAAEAAQAEIKKLMERARNR